jgi:hypothetical protein
VKKADIGVALYLLAAIIMLIVPLESWMLDILMTLNILNRENFIFPKRLQTPVYTIALDLRMESFHLSMLRNL